MSAYSVDLRERIVRRYEEGDVTQAEVAELFDVCERTVGAYLRLWLDTGSLHPRPHRRGPDPKLDADDCAQIKQILQEQSDLTLEALRERLNEKVAVSTVWRTLRKMGVHYKKKPARQRTGSPRRGSGARTMA